jgi:hypothetical protein
MSTLIVSMRESPAVSLKDTKPRLLIKMVTGKVARGTHVRILDISMGSFWMVIDKGNLFSS